MARHITTVVHVLVTMIATTAAGSTGADLTVGWEVVGPLSGRAHVSERVRASVTSLTAADWQGTPEIVELIDELEFPSGTTALRVRLAGFKYERSDIQKSRAATLNMFFDIDDGRFLMACSDRANRLNSDPLPVERLNEVLQDIEFDLSPAPPEEQPRLSLEEVLAYLWSGAGVLLGQEGVVVIRTRFGTAMYPAMRNEAGVLTPLLVDRLWWMVQVEGGRRNTTSTRNQLLYLLDDEGGVPEWNSPWSVVVWY